MISYVVLLRLTQIVTVRVRVHVLPEVLPYFRTKVFYFRKYDTSGSTTLYVVLSYLRTKVLPYVVLSYEGKSCSLYVVAL